MCQDIFFAILYADGVSLEVNGKNFLIELLSTALKNFCTWFNPIRSGGGGGALKTPPPIFCPHAFNFGATTLCVGDFSQKIV